MSRLKGWLAFTLILATILLAALITSNSQRSTERTNYETDLESFKEQQDNKYQELLNKYQQLKKTKVKGAVKKEPVLQSSGQQTAPKRVTGACESYRGLVSKYNWPVDTVLAIMKAESGCNPNAVSPTDDHGLMQLHGIRIYDPAKNIRYAYYNKYMQGGFSHWVVCTKGIVRCWN